MSNWLSIKENIFLISQLSDILLFVCLLQKSTRFFPFQIPRVSVLLFSTFYFLQEDTQCFCFSHKTFFIVFYARNCSVFFSSVIKCFILVFSVAAYYLFPRSVVQLFSFSFSCLRECLIFLNRNYPISSSLTFKIILFSQSNILLYNL